MVLLNVSFNFHPAFQSGLIGTTVAELACRNSHGQRGPLADEQMVYQPEHQVNLHLLAFC